MKKNYNQMYLDSYNKTADYMNSGGIDKFNKSQRKKHGDKYAERDSYTDDYMKEFDRKFSENYNKALNSFYENSKAYQESKKDG